MDQLFLDMVLLLVGGTLDDSCPVLPGSESILCGAIISKRKVSTRVELWLGGPKGPDQEWVDCIQKKVADRSGGLRMYPYRSFHASTGTILGSN